MIEEVTMFEFEYHPFNSSFPIRAVTVLIYAKDRKEAELIAINNKHRFFDEDCTCIVTEKAKGYRQVV